MEYKDSKGQVVRRSTGTADPSKAAMVLSDALQEIAATQWLDRLLEQGRLMRAQMAETEELSDDVVDYLQSRLSMVMDSLGDAIDLTDELREVVRARRVIEADEEPGEWH